MGAFSTFPSARLDDLAAAFIELPDHEIAEVNVPDRLVARIEPDVLGCEWLSDEDLLAFPFERA